MTFIPFLRAPSASIPPTLRIFNIVCEYGLHEESNLVSKGTLQATIRNAAKAVTKTHGGVKMNVRHHDRGHYFPPFLYGEPQPKERLIYDGVKDRFVEEASSDGDLAAPNEE